MNYSKLKLSIESIFSSLKSSFNSSSDIFYPELSITFLNSFFVKIEAKLDPSFYLSFKLKIDRIASISYSSDSGSLNLLNFDLELPGHQSKKVSKLKFSLFLRVNNHCPLSDFLLCWILIQ